MVEESVLNRLVVLVREGVRTIVCAVQSKFIIYSTERQWRTAHVYETKKKGELQNNNQVEVRYVLIASRSQRTI